MAKGKKEATEDDPLPSRSDDLAQDGEVEEFLLELYNDVQKGFEDQNDRSNDLQEYWDIYNCKLGHNQFYMGNSKIFVPIVFDAINARKTRFANQIFPKSGRYVDVTTEDDVIPYAQVALAEHYVRKAKLRTLMPALLKNGDIEGSYHVYVRWSNAKRYVTQRIDKPVVAEEGEQDGEAVLDPDENTPDIEEDVEVKDEFAVVEVIADSDICILPATADGVEEAVEAGGSVTILRRWSKSKIKRMINDQESDKEMGKEILAEMAKDVKEPRADKEKAMVDAAGIQRDGRGRYCLVYETWCLVDIEGKKKRCRTFFLGSDKIGSCKRNPLWCDRIPLISCPVDKVQGAMKGISRVQAVRDLQYFANDACNEAADSSAFAMMPIIMTNPEKNPRIGSMILALAAIWECDPQSTQFAKFPDLWKDGLEIVAQTRNQIFQTLSVNPAQITQTASKQKRNQAELANEQQVDLLTTADAVTVLEEGVLGPVITLIMEMDYQYRDKSIAVARYGTLGREAAMQEIKPIQMGNRVSYQWLGVEAARNAQQMQQQIAAINVIRGVPPEMYQGHVLDLSPVISMMLESVFGPRITPRIFKDIRYQLSQDPEQENEMMIAGMPAFVHPLDDHKQHIAVHMKGLPLDPSENIKGHIQQHMQAMTAALTAQSQAMMPKGQQGGPGGGGPGVAGQPRPGAQPMAPRGGQNPPGAIHQDRMPLGMPRAARG